MRRSGTEEEEGKGRNMKKRGGKRGRPTRKKKNI
jgi:hypothetical protein